jgi:formylglycine-generating enzyme required for sulfatase activity
MRRLLSIALLGASFSGCVFGDPDAAETKGDERTENASAQPETGPTGAAGGGAQGSFPPSASDGISNGGESDVDCGGRDAPPCADGKRCADGSDCASAVCASAICQPPANDDAVKNGDESDVDCGGTSTGAERCAPGRTCRAHADCASDGCGYDGKCAIARSCTARFGGDTCGAGEAGEADAKHESCCTSAPIPGMPNGPKLDKYVVTAGRFRQFVERTNGNLRGFAEGLGATHPVWKQAWTTQLPRTVAETNFLLGPTGNGTARRGCDLGASRARTYWMSDAENKALGETGTHPFSKDILDQKALNCVDWYMVQAFCIWDGGRMAKHEEYVAAWQGGEGRDYPWGNAFDNARLNWKYSYSFPYVYDKGNFVFVGAPGRRPTGQGKGGHADLAGLGMEWLYDVNPSNAQQARFSGSGSWEGHPILKDGAAQASYTPMNRAYWAIVGRCARP